MKDFNIEFVRDFLKNTTLPLNASQEKVSFPILSRIHGRLKKGNRFGPIQVEEETIINGHHRFICLSLLGLELEQLPGTKNTSANGIILWSDVIVDEDDYDTEIQREGYRIRYDMEKIVPEVE